MLDNINSYYSFGSKPNLKKTLPKVRNAILQTIPGVESPQKLATAGLVHSEHFKDLNLRLGLIRAFIKTLYPDGGLKEHFRGQIGIVKAFKVANCDELAEITKTALKTNGIKNCDMFQLYAKSPNNKSTRALDHAIIAIGVKKNDNNKHTLRPFVPRPRTIIMDTFLDGYIGTAKSCKKKFKIFGLQADEILMLKPMKTFEPDSESLAAVKQEFPTLLINKAGN